MVAPALADAHVAARKPFAREADALHQSKRVRVRRLHVRLDAMKAHVPVRGVEQQHQRFGHVALAGVRSERVVAEVGALERPAHDLGEIEHADQRAVLDAGCKVADVLRRRNGLAEAREVRAERLGCIRRADPARVQAAARTHRFDERPGVAHRWTTKLHAKPRSSASSVPRYHNGGFYQRGSRSMSTWVEGRVAFVRRWTDSLFSLGVHAPEVTFEAARVDKTLARYRMEYALGQLAAHFDRTSP